MPLELMRMEKASFLEEEQPGSSDWHSARSPRSDRQQQTRQYVLLAVNVTILVLSLLVNISTWARSDSRGIRETDMRDAHAAIQYEQRAFTGALVYDPESKRAVRKQDAEREYFGPPSEELDAAWHDLLHGEFPVMRPEEAAQFEPELTAIPRTKKFHFEPDMFHTLHCLNAVRLEASKSLYNISGGHSHGSVPGISLPEGWDLAHMEHCMDRIRQSIMCHGDLTPSPLYYWPGFKIALGRTGQHTCRKWQPIREWMDRRASEGPLLEPLGRNERNHTGGKSTSASADLPYDIDNGDETIEISTVELLLLCPYNILTRAQRLQHLLEIRITSMANEGERETPLADAVNSISTFLANERIADLKTCSSVDCIVICISALVFQSEWLFETLESRPSLAKTVVFVGGIGHSTQLLYDAVADHEKYKALEGDIRGLPESRVMKALLKKYFDVEKIESAGCHILIEDKSTNCGSNAIETRKVLEQAGMPVPRNCIIIQDPTMSLRTLASFQKAYQDCASPPKFVSCPLFVPAVKSSPSGLQFANDIPHHWLWSMDRFLELVLGEIPRLRDDENGYGPRGKGFIGRVEIPEKVEESWAILKSTVKDNATGRSL